MKQIYHNLILLSIILISVVQHYSHFSKELISIHVWRQTQTQSTIINFYEEDMNIFNPRRNERANGAGIFRMEFPLMQWSVACLYKVFGNHLIISRLFMFVVGLVSIWGMYTLLSALFNNSTIALVGAWTFNFSPSFYYYTINPLPDNLALCCALWGMAFFFLWYRKQRFYVLIWSGFLLSVGALCKLPFIVYFIVPGVYFLRLVYKQGLDKHTVYNGLGMFGFLLLPLAWYVTVIPQWQNGVVAGVIENQASWLTILDYCHHNLLSTLPELLLNYGSVLFFLAGFYFLYQRKAYYDARFPLMLGWSVAVLAYFFFEINMIEKVHDYYLFPFYPMLFILVSYGAYHLFHLHHYLFKFVVVVLLLLLPVTAYLRMQVRWDVNEPGFNKDLLVYKNELRNAVPQDALVVAGNDDSHFIFLYYIDKKGWAYEKDKLTADELKGMIDQGAEYLYADSRVIDGNPKMVYLFDTLILEKGSVRVYRLKK